MLKTETNKLRQDDLVFSKIYSDLKFENGFVVGFFPAKPAITGKIPSLLMSKNTGLAMKNKTSVTAIMHSGLAPNNQRLDACSDPKMEGQRKSGYKKRFVNFKLVDGPSEIIKNEKNMAAISFTSQKDATGIPTQNRQGYQHKK